MIGNYLSKFPRVIILAIAIALAAAGSHHAAGQTGFALKREHGHYYLTTTFNGKADTEIFVGTGLPGILMDKDSYDTLLADAGLEPVNLARVNPEHPAFRFGQGDRDILKTLTGTVDIGGLRYDGMIFVIDKFDKIAVPIHILKNQADTTANLIRFNFRRKTLDFIPRDSIDSAAMNRYKVTSYAPLLVIETTLELSDAYGHNGRITGPFIFDLGNGTPKYLFSKHPDTMNFLKTGKFKKQTAKATKSGKKAGKGIFAGFCNVGDRTIRGISVGISEKIDLPAIGCVGPSLFLKGEVVIDPENEVILYTKFPSY